MNPDKFTFIDLFCGIGGLRIPFEELGGRCVFSCDWDPDAQKVYQANFGELPAGDITKIPAEEIPSHDVLLAGFPCQAFSIMGNGKGFADTRGTLFFDIERILDYHRPPAILLENVKHLKSHDKGRTLKVILSRLERLGYYVHWKVLNALDFGLPQKRERTFIVGFQKNYAFQFPKGTNEHKTLADILEDHDKVDKRYFASVYIREKRAKQVEGKKKFYPSVWHENRSGNIGINPFACALRATASFNYQLVDGIRRLTPREQLRLQGFPESFRIDMIESETVVRKLTGNSVPIPVVREIAKAMLQAIRRSELADADEVKMGLFANLYSGSFIISNAR